MSDVAEEIVEDVEPVVEEVAEDADPYEEEAVKYGWKPADDWEGEGHISAERFMTRGAGLSRKLTEENKTLTEKFEALNQKLESTESTVSERVARTEKALSAAHEARLAQELKRIEAGKLEAVETADTDAYNRLSEEEAELKKAPKTEEKDDLPVEVKAETDAWLKENTWFNEDAAMQAQAYNVYNTALNMGKSNKEALASAEESVRAIFPAKFKKDDPDPPPPQVDGGGLGLGKSGNKGWSDIPKEDRAAIKPHIDDGLFDALAASDKITPQEAYARQYWSEE